MALPLLSERRTSSQAPMARRAKPSGRGCLGLFLPIIREATEGAKGAPGLPRAAVPRPAGVCRLYGRWLQHEAARGLVLFILSHAKAGPLQPPQAPDSIFFCIHTS